MACVRARESEGLRSRSNTLAHAVGDAARAKRAAAGACRGAWERAWACGDIGKQRYRACACGRVCASSGACACVRARVHARGRRPCCVRGAERRGQA
eukprot:4301835-Pleurochrysis_carterae.AAC.1